MSRRFHWPEYLIEAGALACFTISACTFATLLGHAESPVVRGIPSPLAWPALMGVLMGLTAIAILHSPWGRRSGAQMNPVLTLTFFRLGGWRRTMRSPTWLRLALLRQRVPRNSGSGTCRATLRL